MSAVVVGSGFVGLSCALRLQAAGRAVRVVEAAAAGPGSVAAASHGNAGTFAAYAAVPVNRPGLWRAALPMLTGTPSATGIPPPLALRINAHLPALVPWLLRFMRHCRPARVEHTALALGTLLSRAEAAFEPVLSQAGVDLTSAMGSFADGGAAEAASPFALRNGYLLMHSGAASLEGSARGAELRRAALPGLRMERLDASGVRELEPAVSEDFVRDGGAWYFPDGWSLRQPAALLRAMAAGFEARGGEVLCGEEAAAVGTGAGGGAVVELKGGARLEADVVVVAAGARSAALAKSAGDAIPLDTERGHAVTFAPGSDAVVSRAVCTSDGGFIATPMAGGLRAAGLVEFGGLHAPRSHALCDQLEAVTRRMLGNHALLGARDPAKDWLGFRPTLPDALPVIGRSPKSPAVIYAFGHQHIGWTLGGITGELVTQLATGEVPSVDLSPFRADRFGLLSGV